MKMFVAVMGRYKNSTRSIRIVRMKKNVTYSLRFDNYHSFISMFLMIFMPNLKLSETLWLCVCVGFRINCEKYRPIVSIFTGQWNTEHTFLFPHAVVDLLFSKRVTNETFVSVNWLWLIYRVYFTRDNNVHYDQLNPFYYCINSSYDTIQSNNLKFKNAHKQLCPKIQLPLIKQNFNEKH